PRPGPIGKPTTGARIPGRFAVRLRLAVCACVLLAAGRAGACQVPVFRFALEQWQPGRYELLVFHRGPLGPEAKALLDELEKRGERLNVLVTPVDLDQKPL